MEPNKKTTNPSKEEKKVEKVVTGTVKSKKKSEVRKFADMFVSEDAGNVKSFIFMDVLVPAVKKAISDVVTSGIDIILYGESGRSKKSGISSRISYGSCFDRPRERELTRTRIGYSYDDIILESRGEAEDVLQRMNEMAATYGLVSVADLYDLVGVTGNYTDNNYGWTDVKSASIARVRDGYLLKLPKALPLN